MNNTKFRALITSLVAAAYAIGPVIVANAQAMPDSTLSGATTPGKIDCPTGQSWINGGCGVATSSSCGSIQMYWNQAQPAWRGNTGLAGTYQCAATVPATAPGNSAAVTNSLSNRTGSATYTCGSNGTWSLNTGSTCDGTTSSTVSTQFFSDADTNLNYVIQNCWWNTNYRARGMNATEKSYYLAQIQSYGTSTVCTNVYNSQEAATVRTSGNHIAASTEDNICGSKVFGYPWTLTSQASTCKARPDY